MNEYEHRLLLMMKVEDIGPWRGPTTQEWIARINEGACRLAADGAGGEWDLPWIAPPTESEQRAIWGDR